MKKIYNNLLDVLNHAVTEFPNLVAYQFVTEEGVETLTYRQLEMKAKALAAKLQQLPSHLGQRAVLLLPPGLDYIIGFFGCLYAGVIAVPAYPPRRNHHGQRLAAICNNAEAHFILTHQVFMDHCPYASHLICLDQLDSTLAEEYKPVSLTSNQIAFLQYTSGSTTDPKGVMISHQNILSNLAIIENYFGEGSEKICSWLPPYHDMGLIGGIIYPLYVCQPVILMAPNYFLQSPLRWLEIISEHKVTTSVAPNFAYDLCVKKAVAENIRKLNLSCWRYALNGAEPIRYETCFRFYQTFHSVGFSFETFKPVYGLAEGTLIVSAAVKRKWSDPYYISKESLGQKKVISAANSLTSIPLVSCGQSPLQQEIKIVDPETLTCLSEGEVGEIWVSGPSVATGYWNHPELTQEMLQAKLQGSEKHFLRTGDLGFKQDGELYITGRQKDVIIVNGVNHYPQDIEQTVADSHSAFQLNGTAAFSLDDTNELVIMQEIARPFLNKLKFIPDEVESSKALTTEELFKSITHAVLMEHGLTISKIVLVKTHSLPKTSSGKIQRWICKKILDSKNDNFLAQWDASSHSESIKKTMQENAYTHYLTWLAHWVSSRKVLTRVISSESSLSEFGFDSLLAAELIADLQKQFGIALEPTLVLEQKTVADLIIILSKTDLKKKSISYPLIPQTSHPLSEVAKKIYFNLTFGISKNTIQIDNTSLINYAGYNYIGMSGDEFIAEAVIAAVKEYGSSVSASRIASGQKPLHVSLEKAIANLIGTDDCLVYSSGHATNISVITQLFGPNDLIIHDSLCHNSILQGAVFSGAKRIAFPHNDYVLLQETLEKVRDHYEKVLIVSEGIFSMDGDIPDVSELIRIKKLYSAFLMLDEAHSIGTLGKSGAGVREHFNLNAQDVDIWMGTLSKAFASCGGYIAGSHELIEYLKYNSAGFVYSAGISPANTAAALASIQLMQKEPQRVATLQKRHTLLLNLLQKADIPTGNSYNTPVIPIITGEDKAALSLSLRLKDQGIYAIPIFHPAVEKDKARVRLFVSALHTEEQIRFTVDKIAENFIVTI